MKAEDLIFISDAGHGWLKVPLEKGLPFGTGYGYMDKTFAYLEEDCEASAFLKAHPEIDVNKIPEEYVGDEWDGRCMFVSIPRNYVPTYG